MKSRKWVVYNLENKTNYLIYLWVNVIKVTYTNNVNNLVIVISSLLILKRILTFRLISFACTFDA